MTTFTYTKPTVGGSEDTWGDTLNANWDAIAAFIGPLDSTELAVLDGITASTADLNLLDGVTASTADLNLLDGVTASTAELNLLYGVTATTTEINYLSGVTSAIQDQIDTIITVPSGAVFHFAMTAAPAGYLKADGTAVSRATYAALFAAIGTTFGVGDGATTFNLPDLRGEFVRGWDDARGVDVDRVFGSAQADEFESHNHSLQYSFSSGSSQRADGGGGLSYSGSTGSRGGTETRPRNVALLTCIKV